MISVIIPVYNVEKYLDKCITSILKQSYNDLEILLINDGSTDNSGIICDRFANLDRRIKVFNQSNSGVQKTILNGIKLAKGEFVMFVDSDDYIDEYMCETMLNNIVKNNADVVVCGYNRVYEENEKIDYKKFCNSIVEKSKNIDNISDLLGDNKYFINPSRWNKIYKKELLMQCLKYVKDSMIVAEDANLVFAYFSLCNKAVVIEDCLYNYLIRKSSVTFVSTSYWLSSYQFLFENVYLLLEEYNLNENYVNNFLFNYGFISEIKYAVRTNNKELIKIIYDNNLVKKMLGVQLKKAQGIKHKIFMFILKNKLFYILSLINPNWYS